MKPVSSSELPSLTFNQGQRSQQYHAHANRIGWMRAFSDKPNATFNFTIRDGMGRVRVERLNVNTNPDGQFGELLNLPTNLGDNLEVEVENINGADKIDVLLN